VDIEQELIDAAQHIDSNFNIVSRLNSFFNFPIASMTSGGKKLYAGHNVHGIVLIIVSACQLSLTVSAFISIDLILQLVTSLVLTFLTSSGFWE
jgi:hypothetical protein